MYDNRTSANAKRNCNSRNIKYCVIFGRNVEREREREREREKEREREHTMVDLTTYLVRTKKDSKCGVINILSFLALNSMIKDRKIMTL